MKTSLLLPAFWLILQGGLAMAAGQAVHLKHPVVDWKLSTSAETYEKQAAPLMAMSDAQALAFVPPFGYVQYTECPSCYGGVEGNDVLRWSVDRPEELKCRYCNTVVFPNPKYAETKTLTGKNLLGETVTFPYYYSEEHKAPHFFSTHLWLHKRKWLTTALDAAARAYAVTGKPEYAHRVALVLDKIAQVYPHYPVMQNLPRRYSFREQKAPYNWDSGRWNFFHNEVPMEIIPAYDLVYGSPEFDKLSAQRGYDLREKIEQDFLKAATEAAMLYPDFVSNVIGYSPRSAALLGQVIAEPRFVHWAFGWMATNVNKGFDRDGMWNEGTPSYHSMTLGGLKSCFDAVQGYTDPPGYKDPVDGTRFDNLDPVKQLPLWAKCLTAPETIGLPNGNSACVHDSWYYERRAKPREATLSTILPALGHASLGRGRGDNQLQAQLHFSGAYGHAHYDALGLMLWAKEREMLPDIGYTWTQMRYWATSTLGHNLVVVDRQDQDRDKTGGSLLCYYPGNPKDPEALSISAVEAEAPLAYRSVKDLDLYRRLLVTIPVSAEDAYVVDIFRVRGGKTHDWTLNGSADEDTTATCSLPLKGKRQWLLEEGEKWVEPTVEWQPTPSYGFVRDAARGDFPGAMTLDHAYAGDTPRGLKVRLYGEPGEVWLGRSPSVRRMGGGTSGDMRKAYDFWMPKVLVRRQGEKLQSTFAAIHEPWTKQSFLTEVKRLKVTPDDGLCVALQVRHASGTDTIFSAADSATEHVTDTGITLRGRLGVVREDKGKIVGMWLLDGTNFSGHNWAAQSPATSFEGTLTGVQRKLDGAKADALVTSAKLPLGDTLAGRWLIASLPGGNTQGYEIARVSEAAGQTIIELKNDPALRIEGSKVEEIYFPGRKLEGQCSFRIPGIVSVVRQQSGVYSSDLTAPAEVSLPR